MLSRNKGLKKTSCLKNNKPLRSKASLKAKGNGLQSKSQLSTHKSLLSSNKPLAVHSYKKTTRDRTAELALPKHRRIQNQSAIDACKRETCEICGRTAGGEPHHIISRGAGGPDIKENLIQLCGLCHSQAHSGKISNEQLKKTLAHRLKISVEDLDRIVSGARYGH